MTLPEKKYITSIGIAGFLLLLAGILLLTYSIIGHERQKRIGTGLPATAQVISIAEHACTRGKWSSTCYDVAILFTDHSGKIITTTLENEFDRPTADRLLIRYNQERPELAMLDAGPASPLHSTGRRAAWLLIVAGASLYLGSLVALRSISRRPATGT